MPQGQLVAPARPVKYGGDNRKPWRGALFHRARRTMLGDDGNLMPADGNSFPVFILRWTIGAIGVAKRVKVDAANDLALLKANGRFALLPIAASRMVKLGGLPHSPDDPARRVEREGCSPARSLAREHFFRQFGVGDNRCQNAVAFERMNLKRCAGDNFHFRS